MSRYVDLDGITWDGTPVKSKIMEMETNHGYLQAIGVGWLWGDSVPHIDLQEHDKEIYNKAIDDFADKLRQDKMIITFGLRICDVDRIAEHLKEGEIE